MVDATVEPEHMIGVPQQERVCCRSADIKITIRNLLSEGRVNEERRVSPAEASNVKIIAVVTVKLHSVSAPGNM